MSAGKLAAQVGHAVHDAVVKCKPEVLKAWEADGSMIVVLQVEGETGLADVAASARRVGVLSHKEYDEGLTQVAEGAWTAVAVGPDLADRVDSVTGRLKLYRSPEEEEVAELRRRLGEAEARLATGVCADVGGAGGAAPGWELRGGEAWLVLDLKSGAGRAGEGGGEGGGLRRPVVPELFEQWCWEGDATILPLKWEQAISDCCEGTATARASRLWESPDFDPQGIFFMTHRSDTCGVAAALGLGGAEGVVANLGVSPDFRRRGLGRCLLRLCLQRHAELGRARVFCAVDRSRSPSAWQLLIGEGFQQSPTGPARA